MRPSLVLSPEGVEGSDGHVTVIRPIKEFDMPKFMWVSGRVAEVQRFINVPQRRGERPPARERRELWITDDQGSEFKFVVHTTLMPARRSHRVLALLMSDKLVALHNLQTGEGVNYLRSDPPFLWRAWEAAVAIVAVVGGTTVFATAGGLVPLGLVATTIVVAPVAVAMRWLKRALARRAVDHALSEAMRQAQGRVAGWPALWRVK